VLIAPLDGVGRDYPLSIEKLCPVLSFYVVRDWREGCERCKQILRYGGMGHTMSIHSRNDQIILEFGLKKPAYRIVVNTPTTHGSIGLTTGLDPSMTLGCGGWGGNITSDNISPRHLINIKRLAYETTPAVIRKPTGPGAPAPSAVEAFVKAKLPLPAIARQAEPGGIRADVLARRIDEFLGSRGYKAPKGPSDATAPAAVDGSASAAAGTYKTRDDAPKLVGDDKVEKPTEFVCEDDVRQAMRQGRKIVIGERTIVTPAARDMGEQHRVFVQAQWPR
jgi:acetaldehyde dehydrogenase (acetylating)